MRVQWTVGRIFSTLVAVMFFGAGLCGLWAGWKSRQDFESWKTYRLLEGPVDISAPGEFEFRCVQNTRVPHGAMIWLKLPADGFEKKNLETLFAHFRASISITGDDGVDRDMDEDWTSYFPSRRSEEGLIQLLHLPLLGKGTRQVKVVIHRGVPALKGIPQKLEGRYDLCGCEAAPISMFNFIGGFFTVVGGLIALSLYRGIKKERKRGEGDEKPMVLMSPP